MIGEGEIVVLRDDGALAVLDRSVLDTVPAVAEPRSSMGRLIAAEALHNVRRIPLTLTYVAIVGSLSVLISVLGASTETTIIERASTNLHNLTHGHLATLIGSAFLTGGGPDWILVPLLAGLLAGAELLGGSRRLIGVFAVGHIGATLAVAAGLLIGVSSGWLSTTVAHAQDVGVSYGCAALLGAMTTLLPMRWRPTWSFSLIVAATIGVTLAHTFTSTGHLIALCIGLTIAYFVPVQHRPEPITVGIGAMLAVGLMFGIAIFGGDVEPSWVVPVFAMAAAAVAATATMLPRFAQHL